MSTFSVKSSNCVYSDNDILATITLEKLKTTVISTDDSQRKQDYLCVPSKSNYQIRTERKVPSRFGVMLVGWSGNNGSTFTAGIIANRQFVLFEFFIASNKTKLTF